MTLSVTQCFPLRYKLRPKKQLSIEHILFVPLSGLTDNFEANAGFNINIVPLKVTASKHSFNSQLPKKSMTKLIFLKCVTLEVQTYCITAEICAELLEGERE